MERKGITLTKLDRFDSLEEESAATELTKASFWERSFQLLDLWFLMRGLDPEKQRIDRSQLIQKIHPWLAHDAEGKAQDIDS